MIRRIGVVAVLICLVALTSIADGHAAQRTPIGGIREAKSREPLELGGDIGLSVVFDDSDARLVLQIPVPRLRFGFPVSPSVNIEPSVELVYENGRGSANTFLDAGLDVVYHVKPRDARYRPFVLGGAGLTTSSLNVREGVSFGAGGGVKFRINNTWGTRLEGRLTRFPETDHFRGFWQLGVTYGVILRI